MRSASSVNAAQGERRWVQAAPQLDKRPAGAGPRAVVQGGVHPAAACENDDDELEEQAQRVSKVPAPSSGSPCEGGVGEHETGNSSASRRQGDNRG
jgi:hypothetical protein